ncbi:MAG TPA: hypothetical protein ACFYD6_13870 [Candidatus Brocadiia bacterium]|nr:hypothetical protein [Candidatus Brocadiales bacterium]
MYRILLIILLMCNIGITGCSFMRAQEPLVVSYIKSDELYKSNIRRVIVIPFAYESDREEVVKEVTESITIELQKTGDLDVVLPYENISLLLEGRQLWDKGSINSEILTEARKRFGADAIISGAITHYKPYKPLILGLKLGMINTDTGSLLWSFDGVFDSNDTKVTNMAKSYFEKSSQKKLSIYGWEIMLLSMGQYTRFVANQIVSTLKN